MKAPKVVAVVGYKNTGKTTLIARLVAAFKAEGYRVGTCKHDGAHDIELDVAGTDTWQHRQAGADVTLIASRTQAALQVYYKPTQEPALEQWLAQLADPALALDLVLVEGWKHSHFPKIVLLGPEKIEHLSNVLAYAADSQLSRIAVGDADVYDRDSVEAVVQLIKSRVLMTS